MSAPSQSHKTLYASLTNNSQKDVLLKTKSKMLKHKVSQDNQNLYEKSESYKKEQEAKKEFFLVFGEKILSEFYGATVQDIFEFADKLKEWAIQTVFQRSGVEKTVLREKFFRSKFE